MKKPIQPPASALASGQQCPSCRGRHVLKTLSITGRRLGAYWCAACGTFFDAPIAQQDSGVCAPGGSHTGTPGIAGGEVQLLAGGRGLDGDAL